MKTALWIPLAWVSASLSFSLRAAEDCLPDVPFLFSLDAQGAFEEPLSLANNAAPTLPACLPSSAGRRRTFPRSKGA